MTKLTLRRIFAKREPDKIIDDFQYFEIPLGEEGIVLYVNNRSYLTEILRKFAHAPRVLQANKKDIPHPVDGANAIENVKWSYIDHEYIENIKKNPKGMFNDQWGPWKNEGGSYTVAEYGILKQYVKAKKVKVAFNNKAHLGKIYWIEAYNYYPEFTNPNLGAFAAIIGDSQVLNTTFSANKNDPFEQGTYRYGDTVSLTIKTHLIPNVNTNYHDFAIFEIDIYEYDSDIKVNKTPIRYVQENTDNQTAYNTNNTIEIKIEKKWRDKAKHDKNQLIKYYYAKVKVLHYKNKDGKLGNEADPINDGIFSSHSIGSKVPVVAPNGEQVVVKIEKEDWDKKHFFQISISHTEIENAANTYTETLVTEYSTKVTKEELKGMPFFSVYYNTTSELLDLRKLEVEKMIAEVVKNEYTIKNDEPCKFSAIQVKVKGREFIEIFNENTITTKNSDNSINLFEIVAGDKKKKKITITLDCLEAQHYQSESKTKPRCDGVGLAEGQKHNKENIFDTQNFPVQWISEEDYTIKDNSIDVNLGYEYNKDYADRILNYLAFEQDYLKDGVFNKNLKNIWVVDYLLKIINKETLYQSYAIPVSTCRYSNQVVKLNVYPDMKWVINFTYNIKEPLYYNETPTLLAHNARSSNEFDDFSGNIKRQQEKATKKHIASAYQNQKGKLGIYVHCEVNGKDTIKLGGQFWEKYRKMLSPITSIIEFLDGKLGVSEAKSINDTKLKTDLNFKKRSIAKQSELPVSFELMAPSIGFGVGIGYGESNGAIVDWELEGRIIADPVIGAKVRLDLLALGSKLKPWGIILDVLDLTVWAAEAFSRGNLVVDYRIDIVFESQIKLVGKKTGTDPKTGEPQYEKHANLKYNFTNGYLDPNFSLQGRIEGSIEMSAKIKAKANIKDSRLQVQAELDIGVKGTSYVTMTAPTKLNNKGNLDVDCHFSGVQFEAWVNIGLSIEINADEDKSKKPYISKKIIDAAPLNFTIEL
ncbi:hypothetical protein M4I21_17870 [Cellulophaga sp. 20_2_10]|uniref:hypothetical protein n=1 Tax=Cellulophaga sp. 20_2_10 TaxID=2942476 RepID=UPI00201A3958|nr:hypothetical protein [Cellulophaga sp. 20_2_10]MCL5247685.1 hypothetical protein [Cellulophaga sp. 20_2_10]